VTKKKEQKQKKASIGEKVNKSKYVQRKQKEYARGREKLKSQLAVGALLTDKWIG
jgi:hypothetical protein